MMILKVYASGGGGGRGGVGTTVAPGMNNMGPTRGYGGMGIRDIVAAAGGANSQGRARGARGGNISTAELARRNTRARGGR